MSEQANAERTVICPVEGCDAEKLSRGIHLHVRQSKGDGHGPQGDVPSNIDLTDLRKAGSQQVSMDYPDTRETEQVGRLCPYCDEVFRGKQGIMIHLGSVSGNETHPENPQQKHDGDEFEVVSIEENKTLMQTVESDTSSPSTKQRHQQETDDESSLRNRVRQYIEDLHQRGKDEEANRAEQILLK